MDLFEPGLSFVEGLALIFSPCILPVLPLALSASIDGGKSRPFGIITGFVLSFSIFALASRSLVTALHIDLDIIKYASLVLLLLMGLVMLSSKLSEKFSEFTQGAANIGQKLSGNNSGGYGSGVIIGALIGLVWTPCAGPILAAVLVQVIRQQNDLTSLIIVASFAIGAGLPMLAIALASKSILAKVRGAAKYTETIRRGFGVLIILAVVFIASGIDPQSLFTAKPATLVTTDAPGKQSLVDGLAQPYPAPEISGITSWINSNPLTMAELKGKVVLIDFWTYSCINCVRTLPYITHWDQKYRDKGLVVIGVHAPEFEFEKKLENVKTAVVAHHIEYPVALDSDLSTWVNFNNKYWPAHYLIDRQGNVVYTHFGEGGYDVTENNIRYLLGLDQSTASDMPIEKPVASDDAQTPETYLGYHRAEAHQGEPVLADDQTTEYAYPSMDLTKNSWSLAGSWEVGAEKITSRAADAKLKIRFHARKVFLVLGTDGGKPLHISLLLNGKALGESAGKDTPDGALSVDQHTLYELIDQQTAKEGELEITATDPGLEAYAFTFGN